MAIREDDASIVLDFIVHHRRMHCCGAPLCTLCDRQIRDGLYVTAAMERIVRGDYQKRPQKSGFNINNEVWVRLTESGVSRLQVESELLYGDEPGQKPIPKPGEWTEFQLWDLMNIFGTALYNGGKQLFIDNIIRFTDPKEES